MEINSTIRWRNIANTFVRVIIFLLPADARDWGRAFAAELSAIETPLASFQWLLGGIMLITRARWNQFCNSLGRPFGVSGGNILESEPGIPAPRTPRFVTVSLLAVSALILLHPDVRMALQTVIYANTGYGWMRHTAAALIKKQEKIPEKSKDPQLLALVSFFSYVEGDGQKLADQAIARDPTLNWIEYEHLSRWGSNGPVVRPPARVVQLQKNDPDNAVPRLLSAEIIFDRATAGTAATPYLRSPAEQGLSGMEKRAAENADWLAAMDYSFSAPAYDSYTARRFQLLQDVSTRYGLNDPNLTMLVLVNQHLPDFLNIQSYGNVLLYRGKQSELQGDKVAAIADYRKILKFSEGMKTGSRTGIEAYISESLAKKALARLEPLLEQAGQTEEAAGLESFWNHDQELLVFPQATSHFYRTQPWTQRERAVVAMYTCAAAIILLCALATVSILFALLRGRAVLYSRRRMLSFFCLSVDLTPLLLVACAVTLFSLYRPYALQYKSYFSSPHSVQDFENLSIGCSGTPRYSSKHAKVHRSDSGSRNRFFVLVHSDRDSVFHCTLAYDPFHSPPSDFLTSLRPSLVSPGVSRAPTSFGL